MEASNRWLVLLWRNTYSFRFGKMIPEIREPLAAGTRVLRAMSAHIKGAQGFLGAGSGVKLLGTDPERRPLKFFNLRHLHRRQLFHRAVKTRLAEKFTLAPSYFNPAQDTFGKSQMGIESESPSES
jgi:hypothetical protein